MVPERSPHAYAVAYFHCVYGPREKAEPFYGEAHEIPLTGCGSHPEGRLPFAEYGELAELPRQVG